MGKKKRKRKSGFKTRQRRVVFALRNSDAKSVYGLTWRHLAFSYMRWTSTYVEITWLIMEFRGKIRVRISLESLGFFTYDMDKHLCWDHLAYYVCIRGFFFLFFLNQFIVLIENLSLLKALLRFDYLIRTLPKLFSKRTLQDSLNGLLSMLPRFFMLEAWIFHSSSQSLLRILDLFSWALSRTRKVRERHTF